MFPCLPRILSNKELQFDYIGAVIGVLSLIVTFLVGWNIYTVMDVKHTINKMEDIYKKMENMYNSLQRQIIVESNRNALLTFQSMANLYTKNDDYDNLFYFNILSINAAFKSLQDETAYRLMRDTLDLPKSELSFYKETKQSMLQIMYGLLEEHSDMSDLIKKIIEIINGASETPITEDGV